jgi:dolichol-phosphate mannosyltransferase
MIEKWKQGYQIVHGKRRSRKQDKPFKRWTAKLFYKKAQSITGLQIPQNVGDFKLYDQKVVQAILSMPEHDRLLRLQTSWLGFSQTEVEFDRPARVAGEGHYTFKKMFSLACGGIFPNSNFPLGFAWKAGVFFTGVSMIALLTFLILSIAKVEFGGLVAWIFPALGLCTGLLFMGQAVQNLKLQMIYKEVQNRPKYVVDEEENF